MGQFLSRGELDLFVTLLLHVLMVRFMKSGKTFLLRDDHSLEPVQSSEFRRFLIKRKRWLGHLFVKNFITFCICFFYVV